MGMFMLNIHRTSFAMYAPHDDTMIIVPVEFDPQFVKNMLSALKKVYFDTMLHNGCSHF